MLPPCADCLHKGKRLTKCFDRLWPGMTTAAAQVFPIYRCITIVTTLEVEGHSAHA